MLGKSLTVLVVKPDDEERRVAMFKDNKLRLLMNLVGFSRLGEAHDPDATWIIPSSLTSAQLQESIDLIRKFEFDPPTYEDGKGPEDLLRSKAVAARRSTRRVDFDDDDDNDSEEDRGEYALDEPSARKPDGERKKLKRRRRERTPVELDDEEKNRRAEARRQKELEKKAKTKSTMYIHDSDDEDWDAEKDAEFFAREEKLRDETMAAFKKSLVLGTIEPVVSKKRKADGPARSSKRQKTPPKRKAQPFDDSDDDDAAEEGNGVVSVSSRAGSEGEESVVNDESEDGVTDTPLSSQHAGAAQTSDTEPARKPIVSANKVAQDMVMADAGDEDEDEDEDAPVARRPVARSSTRAGFIIDSDSE